MKKMGVKRSKIWAHYTPCGLFKAECLICHRAVSYLGGSTGNLTRHVRLKHGHQTSTSDPASSSPTTSPQTSIQLTAEQLPLQESYLGEYGIQDAEVVIGTADWSTVTVQGEEVIPAAGNDHSNYTVNIKPNNKHPTTNFVKASSSSPSANSPAAIGYKQEFNHQPLQEKTASNHYHNRQEISQDESALFGAFVAARLRALPSSTQRALAHKKIIDLLYQIERTSSSSCSPPGTQEDSGGTGSQDSCLQTEDQEQDQDPSSTAGVSGGTPVLFVEHAEWAQQDNNTHQIQSIVIAPPHQHSHTHSHTDKSQNDHIIIQQQ